MRSEAAAISAILLTGKERGAVATVLVDGPEVEELVFKFFRPARAASRALPLNAIVFGTWRWRDVQEELVICRTGPTRIEVHCHGGHLAARCILDSLRQAGALEASHAQWSARQRLPCNESAAVRLVGLARTQRTAAILLDQLRGAMRRALESVVDRIQEQHFTEASQQIEALLSTRRLGRHLVAPWSVVVAGPPNVGKSSLVNAMLGYQRALVFDQPGTTRDLLFAETAVDGWPIKLVDTAGLHSAEDEIEAQGVHLAMRQLLEADLVLVAHDASQGDPDWQLPVEMPPDRLLRVITKTDLIATSLENRSREDGGLETSSRTGDGVDQLWQAIARRLVPRAPLPGDAVLVCEESAERLEAALSSLREGDSGNAIARLKAELPSME